MADQVWALDAMYIPIVKGHTNLVAVIDRASRKVLAANIAITLKACHAVKVLQEACNHHGYLRSLTPIKAANIPLKNPCKRLKTEDAGSAWTVVAPRGTSLLLNEYGNR